MTTMVQHAVIEHKGVWPAPSNSDGFRYGQLGVMIWRSEFEAEAKRLGCINGYRYGFEYPTNGKRPELPDDLIVKVAGKFINGNWYSYCYKVSDVDWKDSVLFKVVDRRFKPADTSYLNGVSEISESKPDCESVSESLDCKQKEESVSENHIVEANDMVDNNWHERGLLPIAGTKVELWIGEQYKEDVEFLCRRKFDLVFWRFTNDSVDSASTPTAEVRPIRTEREKFIDEAEAAFKATGFDKLTDWGFLYDAGFRGPKVEKSQ